MLKIALILLAWVILFAALCALKIVPAWLGVTIGSIGGILIFKIFK